MGEPGESVTALVCSVRCIGLTLMLWHATAHLFMGTPHSNHSAQHSVHRDLTDTQEQGMGVTSEVLYARVKPPVPGAQWTGVVTQVRTREPWFVRRLSHESREASPVASLSPSLPTKNAVQIAVQALETGLVEAVVCVQSEPGDHLAPLPVSGGHQRGN